MHSVGKRREREKAMNSNQNMTLVLISDVLFTREMFVFFPPLLKCRSIHWLHRALPETRRNSENFCFKETDGLYLNFTLVFSQKDSSKLFKVFPWCNPNLYTRNAVAMSHFHSKGLQKFLVERSRKGFHQKTYFWQNEKLSIENDYEAFDWGLSKSFGSSH